MTKLFMGYANLLLSRVIVIYCSDQQLLSPQDLRENTSKGKQDISIIFFYYYCYSGKVREEKSFLRIRAMGEFAILMNVTFGSIKTINIQRLMWYPWISLMPAVIKRSEKCVYTNQSFLIDSSEKIQLDSHIFLKKMHVFGFYYYYYFVFFCWTAAYGVAATWSRAVSSQPGYPLLLLFQPALAAFFTHGVLLGVL